MEKIMAVLDVDPEYARQFAETVNEKCRVPFTVIPFSGPEPFLEFAKTHKIEILLLGAEVDETFLKDISVRSVVRLSEGRLEVRKMEERKEEGPAFSVYKYQSVNGIIREVMANYCQEPEKEALVMLGRRAQVLGVYSPLGRCMKTSLALSLGQQLAREGRTLFISFDEFSGLSRLLADIGMQDLSDALYFFRQGEFDVMRLRSMVYTLNNMDYVQPVQYPEDLEQVGGEDAALLLEKLAAECGYDYVVVDVSRNFRNLSPILEQCDVVYMPVREDTASVARLEEFDHYLQVTGREHLRKKLYRLRLPRMGNLFRRETYLEQLLWGELGDFARQLLAGGKE